MANGLHRTNVGDAALLKEPMKVNGGQVPKTPISTGSKNKPSSTGGGKK